MSTVPALTREEAHEKSEKLYQDTLGRLWRKYDAMMKMGLGHIATEFEQAAQKVVEAHEEGQRFKGPGSGVYVDDRGNTLIGVNRASRRAYAKTNKTKVRGV